jgi:formylglycine-generating enzyme required for sulfatase activity
VGYCAWLSETSGRAFRLPHEAMWEKAARGDDGRIYPWGDNWNPARLNSEADEIERTSAVGCFPAGVSPYDLFDCSGNVWEWCSGLDYFEVKYPFVQISYEEDLALEHNRSLRGGAFFNSRQYVRAALRVIGGPDGRDSVIGFRVVEHLLRS